ncbi:structural maintenance of chromosomes protein 2-1-like [Stylonychia lemnae]|uniref:Structural maintenance of chromosomes protein 2-1-like n=1 Tax=Stylonychia lemnae TaxID=5949 RepID=A0A078A9P3_STYLE|nr:structural maintenance of chromosomes protein 2-1-like [Stylonychia lemnae]|eukprot:CDW78995.1 structural maintenance of chromosomes protein 2-1-like [Stylonychia lemnae]
MVLASPTSLMQSASSWELIYKQGNAGVQKAIVTIKFDNKNKKTSPSMMVEADEIIIQRQIFDGKSKYILNGKVETAEKIKNMFMSVQLNVNNPHFLIMQGRITQVVNMKPQELLSLIEEASGTSLYENRKLASLKTISKKQSKVDELTNILIQEINPHLEKLRKEKEYYSQFMQYESEKAILWKQIVAYEFYGNEKQYLLKTSEIMRLRAEGDELLKLIQSRDQEIQFLDNEIQQSKRNDITHIKVQWDTMQKDMLRLEKDLVDKQATAKNVEKTLKDNENVQKKLNRYMEELKRNIEKNKKRRDEVMTLVRKYRREYDLKKEQLKQVIQGLRDLNEGKDIAIDEGVGLRDQMNETKKNLDITLTEIKQVQQSINRLDRERKDLTETLNNLQSSNEQIKQQINRVQSELKISYEILQSKQYNQKAEQDKIHEKKKLEDQLKMINSKLDELTTEFGNKIELKYNMPVPDFDHSLVKGRFIKLFSIKEDRYALALEAIAGQRLYAIVVENDVACSVLMKNNAFSRYRVDLIPNNKIKFKEVQKDVADYVKNVTKGKARFALELIKYNMTIENSVKYVFGDVIICEDSTIAKKLAFDPYVRIKTVTLDGDIYNPQGLLEGGYYQQSKDGSSLKKIKEIQRLEEEKRYISNKIQDLSNDLLTLKQKAFEHMQKKSEIELNEHQLKLLKERLELDQKDAVSIKLKNTEEDLDEGRKKLVTLGEFEQKYRDENERLRNEIIQMESKKDQKKELLEGMLQNLKNEIERITRDLKINQREVDKLEYEGEENEKDMKSSKDQILKECAEKEKLLIEQEDLKKVIDDYTKLKNDKREKMKQLQQEQIKATSKIKEQIEQKQKLDKLKEHNNAEVKKLDNRITKLTIENNEIEQKLNTLQNENPWILNEKEMFGNPDSSEYKFGPDFNMIEKTKRFYKLKDDTLTMKKHVNMRVDLMADQADKDYTELIKKKDKLMVDKERIEKTINELDSLKNATLYQTYQEVNTNFSKIFRTLLPGAEALLEIQDINNIQEGLKLKVAFGRDWKESLSELSGGQRSLLALSFILALLKYKPAPLYILDEIDSALDLSHTQNVGKMIKEHFPESQFLIISLKEGLFNHANVLFKVDFNEGKSKITRFQQQKASKK